MLATTKRFLLYIVLCRENERLLRSENVEEPLLQEFDESIESVDSDTAIHNQVPHYNSLLNYT